MPKSIHHNPDQCAFDFDALSNQPIEPITHAPIEPQDAPTLKQCFKCQQWFPANSTYYTKHPQKKDGWNPSCKGCKNGKPIVIKEIIPEGMKQCSKCKQISPATNSYFSIDRSRSDGLLGICKVCVNAYSKVYNDAHKEEHAQYRREHKEEIKALNSHRYSVKKEEILLKNRVYRQEHKEEIASSKRRYGQSEEGKAIRRRHYQKNKERINARTRRYNAINKEKINAKQRERAPLYRERVRAYNKVYRQSHEEDARTRHKIWYKTHKDEIRDKRRSYNREYYRTEHGNLISRVKSHRRRAIKKHTQGALTPQQVQAKLKSQKHRCYYAACGYAKFKKIEGRYIFHLEHIVPISRTDHNPRHDADNVVLACPACNLRKGARLPSEWLEGGRLL